jgi:hypothetical protein
MSTMAILALVPFALILTYESITSSDWSTQHYCRITLGCYLAVITACAI